MLLLLCLGLSLSGCATTIRSHFSPGQDARPGTIFLAMDGTGNDQLSRTNAVRLFELVDNRRTDKRVATYYSEGVGSDARVIGLATGWGLGHDVRQAYRFLAETWRPDDEIVLTGFSRGAYSARVLAGLIGIAGIPDLTGLSGRDRRRVIAGIFKAYKTPRRRLPGGKLESLDRQNIRRLEAAKKVSLARLRNEGGGVRIRAMALWDTVEALGLPDRTRNPYERLDHYFVSTCNVDFLFHALALEDNREHSFTPILAGGHGMREACPDWRPHVEEVWFSGAHADVGGSYAPGGLIDGYLPGVSMNWMLSRLKHLGLVHKDAAVPADPEGPIHDAKAANPVYKGLTRQFRQPFDYVGDATQYPLQKIVLHRSVVDRMARVEALERENPRCSSKSADGPELPKLICLDDQLKYGFLGQAIQARCASKIKKGYALLQDCFVIRSDEDLRPCDPGGEPWRIASLPAATLKPLDTALPEPCLQSTIR